MQFRVCVKLYHKKQKAKAYCTTDFNSNGTVDPFENIYRNLGIAKSSFLKDRCEKRENLLFRIWPSSCLNRNQRNAAGQKRTDQPVEKAHGK